MKNLKKCLALFFTACGILITINTSLNAGTVQTVMDISYHPDGSINIITCTQCDPKGKCAVLRCMSSGGNQE